MPTLSQIRNSTDSGRKERSKHITWKHVTTEMDKNRTWIRRYLFDCKSQHTSAVYRVEIRPKLPTQPDLKSGNVSAVVGCSCPDFKFRWEKSLADSDNARVVYSNGKPALITNPTNKKCMCKHILSVIDYCLRRNKEDLIKIGYLQPKGPIKQVTTKSIGQDIKNKTPIGKAIAPPAIGTGKMIAPPKKTI